MTQNIKIATSDEDIVACYDLIIFMGGRRAALSSEDFLQQVKRKQKEHGFLLACLIDEDIVQAVAGYRFSEYLGWGKILYLDDLVTREKSRSKGYGQIMFDWLEEQAKENDCEEIHLDSGSGRKGAHRFYLKNYMEIVGFPFSKKVA